MHNSIMNGTGFNNTNSYTNTLRQKRPLSAFSNKINVNPNGTHTHENYDQNVNNISRYNYRNKIPESTGLF